MLNLEWWQQLEQQWKDAFGEAFFKHRNEPSLSEMGQLYECPVLRLAGPTAAYPNVSQALTNLSGIAALNNLETLIVTHHQIKSISEVRSLSRLKSLFIFNNEIEDLDGIENLLHLEQLYAQHNKIKSLHPIEAHIHLRELYVSDNLLESLTGLTEAHAENLNKFICKPNALLKQKEVIRTEYELGIKCQTS